MLGLRTVLFTLVLAAMVPVLALTVYSAVDQRKQAREQVAGEASRLAALAALREADLVEGGRETLAVVTELPAVQLHDWGACSSRLPDFLPLFPQFTNLGIVGPNGDLLCSAIQPEGASTLNFADRPWFQRAVATRGFAAGDYQLGRITGKPSLVFGLPVLSPTGDVEAVAWAALDLSWLQQFAARVHLPGHSAFTIVDRQGVILARHPDPETWVGKQIPEGPRSTLLGRGPGTVEVDGMDGVRRLYAFTPLGDPGGPTAYVFVGIPTSVAYADANHALQRNLTLLAIIALAGLAAAWLVASRLLVRPTRRLTAGARRLAAGDLGARVESRYFPDELGEVARAFNDMGSALERRDADLRRAVDETEKSEVRLQSIIDNAPVVIVVKDPDGRYLMVNRQFEQVTQLGRHEVRGQRDADVFDAETAAVLADHDREVLLADRAVEREISIPQHDGPHTYISLKFPLRDPAGVVYAVCGISADITERVRFQAEREALESQLRQVERLESLGQLAGGVAHDFNNLLAIILNYADFVLDAVPADPPEELQQTCDGIRDDVTAIARAAQSAAGLTRQLLIFARRDAAQPALVDLNSAVENLAPLLRRTLGEDIILEHSLVAGLDPVRADPCRLEQIIVNLAVNARDAMAGGGRLILRTEPLEITGHETPSGALPGRYVRLTVSDTGVGMPPEVAARAFEPFFTTKPMGHGTGLGLATVFGIVTDAGGHISLDSRPGRGTTVRIDLPIATREEADHPGDRAPTEGGAETVLLVEDEEPVRKVAERILTGQGYTVLAASDATEALLTCRRHAGTIDLLVTDVVMPGLSGPKLVEHARSLRPGVRSLYVSGYPEDILARRHPLGDDDTVLPKPFTAESLLGSVRRALSHAPAA